jgi:3,5-epimerase/4-reductase
MYHLSLKSIMHILVYGGAWISTLFKDVCGSTDGIKITQGGRISDRQSVYDEVFKISPDRVISIIGRTHGEGYNTIDYLEQEGKLRENVNDNLYAPLILADVCKELGIHMTYIGTGCIFTYEDDKKVFTEDDVPNFFGSSYSTVKGFADRLMKDLYGSDVLNVRIRMPIHSIPHPRNFITKIVNYKKICSVPNSMTVFDDLLPILVDLMRMGLVGTINMCSPGAISHNEILEMYKEIVDPTHTWENFSYEEQLEILAAGRSNNELDGTKLTTLAPEVKDIKTAVREILIKYKESLNK